MNKPKLEEYQAVQADSHLALNGIQCYCIQKTIFSFHFRWHLSVFGTGCFLLRASSPSLIPFSVHMPWSCPDLPCPSPSSLPVTAHSSPSVQANARIFGILPHNLSTCIQIASVPSVFWISRLLSQLAMEHLSADALQVLQTHYVHNWTNSSPSWIWSSSSIS